MFSIGQVSKHTGIKVPTIRYYEEIELVSVKLRSSGNQRRYSNDDLRRLSFIKHARELGFSIASVRQLIDLSDSDLSSCVDIDRLASDQLLEVKGKIKQLEKLESELDRMLVGCKTGELNKCYVVESLSNHALCRSDHDKKLVFA
jgi:DNA-binding transcriptional MerR regulator